MTVRAGRGWAKKRRLSETTKLSRDDIFVSFSAEFPECTGTGPNPQKYSPALLETGSTELHTPSESCLVSTRPSTAAGRRRLSGGV